MQIIRDYCPKPLFLIGFLAALSDALTSPQIARQLGLRTVAEFVESQAALDCLRELGIDYAQGYFIDRPQPLSSLADATLTGATNNNGA